MGGDMRQQALVAVLWATVASVTADAALVGHWALDETGSPATVADSSGSGLDGAVYGATPVTGAVDGGMSFDGVDDYIEVPADSSLDIAGAITIAFWIKPDTWDPRGMWMTNVLAKRVDGAQHPYQVVLTGDGSLQFAYYSTAWTSVESADALAPVGEWTHVAFTRDAGGTQIQVYKNGALVETLPVPTPGPATMLNGGYGLQMGHAVQPQDNNNNWFDGALDDLRIYDDVLTAPEIADIHDTDGTPVVSVDATDPDAAEDGDAGDSADVATVVVARTGATDDALVVTVSVTDPGSADAGDYAVQGATPTTGSEYELTVPASSASATVTLVALNDEREETQQTVSVTVVAGSGYAVDGAAASADVSIADDDVLAPGAFALTDPVDDVDVTYNGTVTLAWDAPSASMFSATVYDVVLADNASLTSPLMDIVGASIDPAAGTCSYVVADGLLDESTAYWWQVTARNDGGSTIADNAPATFTTAADTDAPYVTATTPPAGEEVDPDDFSILVTFSEPIVVTGNLEDAVTVDGLAGTVALSGDDALAFTPTDEPAYETTYVVTVAADITDTAASPNSLDGNAGVLVDFSFTVDTTAVLPGLGNSIACAAGNGAAAPWGLLLALLVVGASSAGRRRRGALVGCAALMVLTVTGCGTTGAALDLGGRPVGDFSTATWKKKSDISLAPRVGYVSFQGGDVDVPARVAIGAFGRLLETDSRRVEVGIDLVPSFEDERTNLYTSLTADYVGFLGDGTLFWKAGGGMALERRDDAGFVVGLLEAGVGVWLPMGRKQALVLSGTFQVPVGDVNPSSMLVVAAGYEF